MSDPTRIHLVIDGTRVSGEIEDPGTGRLAVRITAPFAGPRRELGVPAHDPIAVRQRGEELLTDLLRAGLPAGGRDVVRFAHGKDSVAWSWKVQRLAPIAERHGFAVESPDYSDTMDPDERVRRLLALGSPDGALVLVGSSMGAYVSTVASEQLHPLALFLLAPAVYLEGYAVPDPTPRAREVEVVHGWNDDVVPVDHAIRFADRHAPWLPTRLHLLPDGHPLADSVRELDGLFDAFLTRVRAL
jgi:hypothetical protein